MEAFSRERTKKACPVLLNVKVLVIVFLDYDSNMNSYYDLLPSAVQSIGSFTLKFYIGCVRQSENNDQASFWILHHDNVLAHTSLLIHTFLDKNNTVMLPQPPYSPEMGHSNFPLFPKRKAHTKDKFCVYRGDKGKTDGAKGYARTNIPETFYGLERMLV